MLFAPEPRPCRRAQRLLLQLASVRNNMSCQNWKPPVQPTKITWRRCRTPASQCLLARLVIPQL